MAIWNEILEGGLNQLLAKRLGMQVGSPTPAVSPEMQASLVLENDRPEWSYYKQELLMSGRAAVAAVAAQFSFVALSNPANSNVLCVVTEVRTRLGASNGFMRLRNFTAAGAPATPSVRDGRQIAPFPSTAARGACNLTAGTAAAASPEPVLWYPQATLLDIWENAIILRPSQQLEIIHEVAFTALPDVGMTWRERGANSGELG